MTEEAKQYITPKEGGWVADFVGFFVEPNKKGGTSAYISFSTDCGEGKVYHREYLRPSESYGWKYPLMTLNKVGKCIGSQELAKLEAKTLDDIYTKGQFQFGFVGQKVFLCFEKKAYKDKSFLQISSISPFGIFPQLKNKADAIADSSVELPRVAAVQNPLPDFNPDDDVPF